MKEFELPPEVRPHSIAADRGGNIWYMGNGNGTVGKLNPATGEITVYTMPDPAARDPHTADLRSEGPPVVHAPGIEHGRPSDS